MHEKGVFQFLKQAIYHHIWKQLNICNFSTIAACNQISFWEININFLFFKGELGAMIV